MEQFINYLTDNITSIAFASIVIYFVWKGYRKGFISSTINIFSLAIAYIASFLFTHSLSKIIDGYSPISGLMVYFVSGGLIFLIFSVTVNYFSNRALAMLLSGTPQTNFTRKMSKISGVFIGVLFGCFVGLFVVYFINFKLAENLLAKNSFTLTQSSIANSALESIPESQTTENDLTTDLEEVKPKVIEIKNVALASQNLAENDSEELEINTGVVVGNLNPVKNNVSQTTQSSTNSVINNDSFIDSAAKKMVSKMAASAVDLSLKDPVTTQLTKVVSRNPQFAIENIKNINNDPQLIGLLSDPVFQDILNREDSHEVLNSARFHVLTQNYNIKKVLDAIEIDNKTGKTAKEILAEGLVLAWSSANLIKNDPKALAIIHDPEFQKQLNSENAVALLMNPKLKTLAEMIFAKGSIAK